MTLVTLFALSHGGDDSRMELLYFWAAVLLALTPVLIFGGIGVVILRSIWRERRGARAPAPLDASDRRSV